LKIKFYNVGQGDTVLLEWNDGKEKKIGILDCNKVNNRNRIIEYLSVNSISSIEFIILSHFHYDHFSGMSDVFKFCIENDIHIKYFLHTFASQLLDLYNRVFTSKKFETEAQLFFKYFDELYDKIDQEIIVTYKTSAINLTDDIILTFHAPDGKAYHSIARQISRLRNDLTTSLPDINILSTIICIQNTRNNQSVLLTSDAVKKSFKKIRTIFNSEMLLVQAPHHGSNKNIDNPFWENLTKKQNCSVIFSVGDEPKDKLPDLETIKFFDQNNYEIRSTNCVYGISDYFGINQHVNYKPPYHSLNHFSKLKRIVYTQSSLNSNLSGDQTFILN